MKRWYIADEDMAHAVRGHRAHSWTKIGEGKILMAVNFADPDAEEEFASSPGIVELGHIHENIRLPEGAHAHFDARHGVKPEHGTRDAVKLVVKGTRMRQLFLDEL